MHQDGEDLVSFLPSRRNDLPIEASELREVLRWTLNEPNWEKEMVSSLTVHRLPRKDEVRNVHEERGRCEVILEAPIETVYALVDNPEERAKWDNLVGHTMKKYKARFHKFVSFKFEGMMGLASEDFFFWDAQQAYDVKGVECDSWTHLERPVFAITLSVMVNLSKI